jgi:hypothetical protein
MWARIVSVGLGLWAMTAPPWLGQVGWVAWHDRAMGFAVMALALCAMTDGMEGLRRGHQALGVWSLVAAAALPYPLAGRFAAAALGLALLICGATPHAAPVGAEASRRRPA